MSEHAGETPALLIEKRTTLVLVLYQSEVGGAALRYTFSAMDTSSAGVPLSTDLDDPEAIPYFCWDEPMTVRELRERLQSAARPERIRLMAKILREARDTEVWKFTSPQEVVRPWEELAGHPGRRRPFWEFLSS